MGDNIAIAAAILVYILYQKKKSSKRRFWLRPSLRNRRDVPRMLQEFRMDDINRRTVRSKFELFLRVLSEDFETLLCLTGPIISKANTNWRSAIPAQVRLTIALRYLATGESYFSLGTLFTVSPQIVGSIISVTAYQTQRKSGLQYRELLW